MLPTDKWTLVGGLMVQLHSIHHGLGIVRPTNDVDIVLHIETSQGVAAETAAALRSLGYELRPAVDPRDNTAHRFFRGTSKIDLVTDRPDEEDAARGGRRRPGLRSPRPEGHRTTRRTRDRPHRGRHAGAATHNQRATGDRARNRHHSLGASARSAHSS